METKIKLFNDNFQNFKRYGIQKYYEGLEKGLEFAESLFECRNYEKENNNA